MVTETLTSIRQRKVFTHEEVMQLLPHGADFHYLIDTVEIPDGGEVGIGTVKVTPEFCRGHYGGDLPRFVPRVAYEELIDQTGIVLLSQLAPWLEAYVPRFMGEFGGRQSKRAIVPGETIEVRVRLETPLTILQDSLSGCARGEANEQSSGVRVLEHWFEFQLAKRPVFLRAMRMQIRR